MTIHEIMTSGFEMIDAEANIIEVAKKMKQLNVGTIPVNQGKNLIGLVTDRDIVIRCLAEGKDPASTSVKDIISEHLVTIDQQADISEAEKLMEEYQLRRLIVTDKNNSPVGILSLGDIAVKCHDAKISGEILEGVSKS
jgi:CBS domain-containing protein